MAERDCPVCEWPNEDGHSILCAHHYEDADIVDLGALLVAERARAESAEAEAQRLREALERIVEIGTHTECGHALDAAPLWAIARAALAAPTQGEAG